MVDGVWMIDCGRRCLDVSDDGCGFDPAQVRQGGLGLAGMQERARLIGAKLDVSSRHGSTRVRLDLRPESGRAVVGSLLASRPLKVGLVSRSSPSVTFSALSGQGNSGSADRFQCRDADGFGREHGH